MQLFVAGLSYREIARAVGLRSPQSVCNIVERGLADGGPRREPLADDALAMFIERSEAVLRAHWRRAMEGDVRATEAVRRIWICRPGCMGCTAARPAAAGAAVMRPAPTLSGTRTAWTRWSGGAGIGRRRLRLRCRRAPAPPTRYPGAAAAERTGKRRSGLGA